MSIPEGAVLWGFWPTSTVAADLQLKATEPKGHWIEIIQTRQKLMHTYNRYVEVSRSPDSLSSLHIGEDELVHMAWNALFRGVWEGAYLLSQYVLSPNSQTQKPIHPLGIGMSWTAPDADLASVVIFSRQHRPHHRLLLLFPPQRPAFLPELYIVQFWRLTTRLRDTLRHEIQADNWHHPALHQVHEPPVVSL